MLKGIIFIFKVHFRDGMSGAAKWIIGLLVLVFEIFGVVGAGLGSAFYFFIDNATHEAPSKSHFPLSDQHPLILSALSVLLAFLCAATAARWFAKVAEMHDASTEAGRNVGSELTALQTAIVASAVKRTTELPLSTVGTLAELVEDATTAVPASRLRAHIALRALDPSLTRAVSSFAFCRDESDAIAKSLSRLHRSEDSEVRKSLAQLKVDDFVAILQSLRKRWRVVAYKDLPVLFEDDATYILTMEDTVGADSGISVRRLIIFPDRELMDSIVVSIRAKLQSDTESTRQQIVEACRAFVPTGAIVKSLINNEDAHVELPAIEHLSEHLEAPAVDVKLFISNLIYVEWLMSVYHDRKCHLPATCHVRTAEPIRWGAGPMYDDVGRILLRGGEDLLEPLVLSLAGDTERVCVGAAVLDDEVLVAVLEKESDVAYVFLWDDSGDTMPDGADPVEWTTKQGCARFRVAFDRICDHKHSFDHRGLNTFYARLFDCSDKSHRKWIKDELRPAMNAKAFCKYIAEAGKGALQDLPETSVPSPPEVGQPPVAAAVKPQVPVTDALAPPSTVAQTDSEEVAGRGGGRLSLQDKRSDLPNEPIAGRPNDKETGNQEQE